MTGAAAGGPVLEQAGAARNSRLCHRNATGGKAVGLEEKSGAGMVFGDSIQLAFPAWRWEQGGGVSRFASGAALWEQPEVLLGAHRLSEHAVAHSRPLAASRVVETISRVANERSMLFQSRSDLAAAQWSGCRVQ